MEIAIISRGHPIHQHPKAFIKETASAKNIQMDRGSILHSLQIQSKLLRSSFFYFCPLIHFLFKGTLESNHFYILMFALVSSFTYDQVGLASLH